MSGPPAPPPSDETPGPNGVRLEGAGDVTVGGDVAGRDVVRNQTTINQAGLSEKTVLRLVMIVGALVFITAACFFSGGVLVGAVALTALDRPVASTPEKAQLFENQLAALSQVAPGQPFSLVFSESEISSYVKYRLGPELGFLPETGKVRLVDGQHIVVSGQLAELNGLEVAVTLALSNVPDHPLTMQGGAARILRFNGSVFGWVGVPAGLLQPLVDQMNSRLGQIELQDAFVVPSDPADQIWALNFLAH